MRRSLVNLAAIQRALAGNPDVTILRLEGLNHLFQTAKTGAVGEYAQITETMSPVALAAAARPGPCRQGSTARPCATRS